MTFAFPENVSKSVPTAGKLCWELGKFILEGLPYLSEHIRSTERKTSERPIIIQLSPHLQNVGNTTNNIQNSTTNKIQSTNDNNNKLKKLNDFETKGMSKASSDTQTVNTPPATNGGGGGGNGF